MKTLKTGSTLHRSFAVTRELINAEARTVELAFSSEEPYDRWWGREILDHDYSSINLTRLQDGAPLLMDHDTRDHVGVIESVQIGADRVGRAVVRFGKSARAEEVWQDVKDGIRRNVSMGYVINKAVLEEKNTEIDTYRVTDWTPFEVSMVAVPADATVGVGRSKEFDPDKNPVIEIKDKTIMTETVVNVQEHETRGADFARKQINEIIAIGQQYKCTDLASEAVRSGKTIEEFKNIVMEKMANKPVDSADIGMSVKEAKNFSFMRAINAMANPADRKAQQDAQFEREASDAFATKYGRSAQGFFVPLEVQKRDLNVTTNTAGGHTVSTNLLAQSFVELLRSRMQVTKMGAQTLSGLTGSIAIPRQTGGATAYWVAESGSPTETQQAFDQVTMNANTVAAFTDISRKLLLQSSLDVEAFVRNDLATVLALELDRAAIAGTGVSNQPKGILATSGIGDVAGGPNGLAPTWAHIVELWSDLAVANADFSSLGILTNAKAIGKLMGTLKAPGVAGYIIEKFPGADGFTSAAGLRVGASNQAPSNLVKGSSGAVCSALISGNWSDLIIGQWGTLDLMVDPYTGSTSGTVRVVALQDADIAIRHPESFSSMKDALTT